MTLDKSVAELMTDAGHDPEAQFQIYAHYISGTGGVNQDINKAMEWLSKAAENGYMYAQYALHLIYSLGPDILRDDVKSLEWATKAAEQGCEGAKIFMRLYRSTGPGAPKGGTEPMMWCAWTALNSRRSYIHKLLSKV